MKDWNRGVVMNNSEKIITFIIVAFAFAVVLIMKKDTLPAKVKRPLAIVALVIVSFAFILMLYSFFTMK